MITLTIPSWIAWILIGLLTINTFLLGIKVWYGWSLTRDQRKNK